jgi:hypothetical protein
MNSRATSAFGAPRNSPIGSTPTDVPPDGIDILHVRRAVGLRHGLALKASVKVDGHAGRRFPAPTSIAILVEAFVKVARVRANAHEQPHRLRPACAHGFHFLVRESESPFSVRRVSTARSICCWISISKDLLTELLCVGLASAISWKYSGSPRSSHRDGGCLMPRRASESVL